MRPPKLTVYTAVFGYTDPLHDSAIQSDAHFICFTDDKQLKSKFWDVVYLGPVAAPNRFARTVKSLSHEYVHTEWSLWMDCSFTLKVDPLQLLGQSEFTNIRHPYRNTVYEEAQACIKLRKAKDAAIMQQVNTYHREGFDIYHPPVNGLGANGFILRRHTEKICRLNQMWKAQHDTYTLRDQLCLDYVLWKQGIIPERFPGTLSASPYYTYTQYRRPVSDF